MRVLLRIWWTPLLILAMNLPLWAKEKETAKAEKDDQRQIQGIWKAVALESDGTPRSEDAYSGTLITFQDNKLIMAERGYKPETMTFRLDASKAPKAIDLIMENAGPHKGESVPAIYELKGDDLKLCLRLGKKRPAEFKTLPGDDTEMFTLKRLPAEQKWKRFTVKAEGYSVEFPGEPEARKRQDNSRGIAVEVTDVVRSDRERLSFLAMGYKLPVRFTEDAQKSLAFDAARDNWLSEFKGNLHGKLDSETKLDTKAGLGREYHFSSDEAAAVYRCYLFDDRMITLQVVGTNEAMKSKSVERFLGSLRADEKP